MGLLYTKMKVFHHKEKIDSLPKEKKEIMSPVHIRIKPTNVCNHNCNYCAYRSENLQLGQGMSQRDFIPKEKMIEIMEDCIEMGVKAVTFSGGGEPFCYPYLLDAVNFLAQHNVRLASLTNGSGLNGEVSEIFSKHATWLRVSMDGWDDESYSSYRRVARGEFTKVMNNMKNFKSLRGKCYLGVVIVVNKDNAEHVYEFIGKLYNVEVNSVKVSPCIVSNDGKENNAYHAPFFDIVKKQITRAIEDFTERNFEIFDAYHDLDDKFKKEYSWCPYLQILPVIGADLNIYPCQDKAYNLEQGLVGSIKNQRFKDFWFSDKNIFFKINPSLHCNHHCVANAKNRMLLEYLEASPEHRDFV